MSAEIDMETFRERQRAQREPGPDEWRCPDCNRVVRENSRGREIGHETGSAGDREQCPRHPDNDEGDAVQTAFGGEF